MEHKKRGQHSDARAAVEGRDLRMSLCQRAWFCEQLDPHYTSLRDHAYEHIGDFSMDYNQSKVQTSILHPTWQIWNINVEMSREAQGGKAMNRARCLEWRPRLKNGRTILEDEEG